MKKAGRPSRLCSRPSNGDRSTLPTAGTLRKIDTRQVRGRSTADCPFLTPGELGRPRPRLYLCTFIYSGEFTRQAPRPSEEPGRPGRDAGCSAGASSFHPCSPPSTPAAGGAQVGTACECLQDVRLCVTDVSVRGRVHARWARRLTLQSPEPAPRTRTGPLQLPRAMILWKQKLKVGRNNGGPIGCNLGQARTC